MFVKICGLTVLEEARAALDYGADALGFNFYPPSPRYLPPQAAAPLIRALRGTHPQAVCVGVFVNTPLPEVQAILHQCGLDAAQLHGEETPADVAALAGRAFKAFRGLGAHHAAYARASAPAFLVDAYSPTLYGGTGHTADWAGAHALAQAYPLLLAGGLTPQNVAAAIAQVQPWGVDVASGVERAPGHKDPDKLRQFIHQAKHP